jgi:uncharacterized protein (DUF427 family)
MAHGDKSGGRGHHVVAVPGDQHVKVTIDGTVVAETRQPVLLYETGIPVCFYIPPSDIDLSLFEATDTHTTCPFKGVASYWTYQGASGEEHPDCVWAYEDPLPAVSVIKGHLSFYGTVAGISVEGDVPATPPEG